MRSWFSTGRLDSESEQRSKGGLGIVRPMDRRILAAFLHFAHLFLAGAVIAVVTMGFWALLQVMATASGSGATDPGILFFVCVLAVLCIWWGSFLVFGLVRARQAMREAMNGDFAGANARLRWAFDREPWLRIAG